MSNFSENVSLTVNCPTTIWNDRFIVFTLMDIKNRILLIAVNAILFFFTVFLNLLSVIIRKSSQLKHKLCYFVILVQSTIDFLGGILEIPVFIIILNLPFVDIKSCLVFRFLFVFMLSFPSLTPVCLSAMTLERYIGVIYPFSYRTLVTQTRILIYVGRGHY